MSKSIDVLANEFAEKYNTNINGVIDAYKAGYKQRNDELIDLLIELDEYFDDKADADGSSEGYTPNKEMRFLVKIRQYLEK